MSVTRIVFEVTEAGYSFVAYDADGGALARAEMERVKYGFSGTTPAFAAGDPIDDEPLEEAVGRVYCALSDVADALQEPA